MSFVLHLEGDNIAIKGATKVVSSTEAQAVIEIGEKSVVLSGEGIEVKKLNLDEGEVCLNGLFSMIKFASAKGKKGSIIKRIFK